MPTNRDSPSAGGQENGGECIAFDFPVILLEYMQLILNGNGTTDTNPIAASGEFQFVIPRIRKPTGRPKDKMDDEVEFACADIGPSNVMQKPKRGQKAKDDHKACREHIDSIAKANQASLSVIHQNCSDLFIRWKTYSNEVELAFDQTMQLAREFSMEGVKLVRDKKKLAKDLKKVKEKSTDDLANQKKKSRESHQQTKDKLANARQELSAAQKKLQEVERAATKKLSEAKTLLEKETKAKEAAEHKLLQHENEICQLKDQLKNAQESLSCVRDMFDNCNM